MVELTKGARAKTESVAKPLHLLGLTGNPSEVAEAVAFLLVGEHQLHHWGRHSASTAATAPRAPNASSQRYPCL
jgi:hypothetical protein